MRESNPPPFGPAVIGVAIPLVGTGVLIVFPDEKLIGWMLIGVGLLVLFSVAIWYVKWWLDRRPKGVPPDDAPMPTDIESFRSGVRTVLSQGQGWRGILVSRTKWDRAGLYVEEVWKQPTFSQRYPKRVQELVRQVIVANRQMAEPDKMHELRATITALLLYLEDLLRANPQVAPRSGGRSRRDR